MVERIVALASAAFAIVLPTAAGAYIGPGAGASLAGSLLAVLAAIALAVAIVLFWPLKLLYRKIRGTSQAAAERVAVEEDQHTASPGAAE